MIFKNVFASMKSGTAGEAFRHARRARRKVFSFPQVVFFASVVFLFLPLIVLVIASFNESITMRWTGFSLRWYQRLFTERQLWNSFWNSIIIALTSATAATIIGTIGAIGVSWYRFRLRGYVRTISFLPMTLPDIIRGVSLAVFFAGIGVPLGLTTVFVAHTTFNLPFVFLLVTARLDEFDFSIVEAAHDLGATERQTLFKITIPFCMPGILAGFLTAITLSLEDFVVTFFVAGPGAATLPVFIFSAIIRGGAILPVVSALSVLLIAAAVLMAVLLRNFLKRIAAK